MNAAATNAPIEIGAKDLNGNGGIFCPSPMAGMKIWNTHPRIFLDISHGGGGAKCPYCGTVYQLRAGEHVGGGH